MGGDKEKVGSMKGSVNGEKEEKKSETCTFNSGEKKERWCGKKKNKRLSPLLRGQIIQILHQQNKNKKEW